MRKAFIGLTIWKEERRGLQKRTSVDNGEGVDPSIEWF
jgi:hypothetical protein